MQACSVREGVVVGLGSNLGDRRRELGKALAALDGRYGLEQVSGVYASGARGPGVSGEFLNLCALLRTAPSPQELLDGLHEIEGRAGRPRTGSSRSGDRRLDLDLLLYGERQIRETDLVVPHPRLSERAFVLIPLGDLGADRMVPGTGRTVRALAGEVETGDLRHVCPGRELMNGAWTGGTFGGVEGRAGR